MANYIDKAYKDLGIPPVIFKPTPMTTKIQRNEPVTPAQHKWFQKAVGKLGWIAFTTRFDVRFAFQQLAYELANPSKNAIKAIIHTYWYLMSTKFMAIQAQTNTTVDSTKLWSVYSDSDFCNDESRSATCGMAIMFNGMCITCRVGKATSALANDRLLPGHVNVSVAASEIFALSETSNRALGISYMAREFGVPMPTPIPILGDNAASITFHKATACKSRLVQFDTRLQWIKTLRDRKLFDCIKVGTADNIADIFTKITTTAIFQTLRTKVGLLELPKKLQSLALLG
jgi:hypothetical protein